MHGITVPIIVHHYDLEAWLVALAKLVLHLVNRARVPLVVVLVVYAQSTAHGRCLVVCRHLFVETLARRASSRRDVSSQVKSSFRRGDAINQVLGSFFHATLHAFDSKRWFRERKRSGGRDRHLQELKLLLSLSRRLFLTAGALLSLSPRPIQSSTFVVPSCMEHTIWSLARTGATAELSKLVTDPDAEVPVDLADDNGVTALMHAAAHGHEECVCRLLEVGANAALQDRESGYSALHRAFLGCKLATAAALVRAGVSVHEPLDHEGLSPLELLHMVYGERPLTSSARPLARCTRGAMQAAWRSGAQGARTRAPPQPAASRRADASWVWPRASITRCS